MTQVDLPIIPSPLARGSGLSPVEIEAAPVSFARMWDAGDPNQEPQIPVTAGLELTTDDAPNPADDGEDVDFDLALGQPRIDPKELKEAAQVPPAEVSLDDSVEALQIGPNGGEDLDRQPKGTPHAPEKLVSVVATSELLPRSDKGHEPREVKAISSIPVNSAPAQTLSTHVKRAAEWRPSSVHQPSVEKSPEKPVPDTAAPRVDSAPTPQPRETEAIPGATPAISTATTSQTQALGPRINPLVNPQTSLSDLDILPPVLAPTVAANTSVSAPQSSPNSPASAATQIAVAVHRSDNGTTEIRLNPEELGRVRIALTTHDAVLTVTILAERPETADLLRRNLEALAREFLEIGYDTLEFEFGDAPDDAQDDATANPSEEQSGRSSRSIAVNPDLHLNTRQPELMHGTLDLKL